MMLIEAIQRAGFLTEEWALALVGSGFCFLVIRYMNRIDKMLKEHSEDIMQLKINQAVAKERDDKWEETMRSILGKLRSVDEK